MSNTKINSILKKHYFDNQRLSLNDLLQIVEHGNVNITILEKVLEYLDKVEKHDTVEIIRKKIIDKLLSKITDNDQTPKDKDLPVIGFSLKK